MADILVFIRNNGVSESSGNWMDGANVYEQLNAKIDNNSLLTAAQKTRNKEKIAIKYAGRSQPGDIVDVKPDGFYCEPKETTGRGWNHHCYALIRCPKLSMSVALAYLARLQVGDVITRKHRFSIAALGLAAGEVRTISKASDVQGAVVDKNG